MTRKEITGTRDLSFSSWIREKLPDSSTGYMATDVDFFLYNYKTKDIVILEVKTRKGDVKKWQRIFYKKLNEWIKKGITADWTFHGVYLIQFENTCFEDGKCFLNRIEITEEQLIKKLSFKK